VSYLDVNVESHPGQVVETIQACKVAIVLEPKEEKRKHYSEQLLVKWWLSFTSILSSLLMSCSEFKPSRFTNALLVWYNQS
jgi:hypothetical protein